MSKVDQKLDELLDIQGEIIEVEKNLPTLAKAILNKKNKIQTTSIVGKCFTVL